VKPVWAPRDGAETAHLLRCKQCGKLDPAEDALDDRSELSVVGGFGTCECGGQVFRVVECGPHSRV